MSIREKFEDSIYDALRKWYQKRKRWQKTAIKWFISLAVAGYLFVSYALPTIREWWANRYSPFPKDVAGILVLRIEGDDVDNDLQRRLVSELNISVRKEAVGQKIEVRGQNELVSESIMGLTQAHAKAREIGKACKAILVIWGNRVDDNTFYPRLTVVESKSSSSTSGQWALAAQDITELKLPSARVDQPVYLKHFVTGYAFYDRENYAAALTQFKAALNQSVINPIELNEIRTYSGDCHYNLAHGQREMAFHLQQAIAYFDTVLSFYSEQDFPEQWARTQHKLGCALGTLSIGDRSENIQKAIDAYQAALRVQTEGDFPVEWAMTQNNLGVAYMRLPIGEKSENLRLAIRAYDSALRVRTEKAFPTEWAMTQINLGNAHFAMPTSNRSENLENAFIAYSGALRVLTKTGNLIYWALAQNNLGNVYLAKTNGNRDENLLNALEAYNVALRVRTRENFPFDWAMTMNNIGLVYKNLNKGDRIESLGKAADYFRMALEIWTVDDFPNDHQKASGNLSRTLEELQRIGRK